jgi:DNA-binding transcriptional LysR family regulator
MEPAHLRIEIRHLRYFIAVADRLSFTRAAEHLGIAQPPLSQQIQALESELGIMLFDRKTRPLQLTQAGLAFLADARSILATLQQAVHNTKRIHVGELGYVVVGFTSSMANGVLPDILRTFQQDYPDVNLILREENSSVQIDRLRAGQADLVFIYQDYQTIQSEDLKVLPLPPEPLVVVLPEYHRLVARLTLSLSDLAGEPFIMPLPQLEAGLFPRIEAIFKQAEIEPNVVQKALFMVTILGLVSGEIGVSILPSSVQNLQRKGVVYRPLIEETIADRLTAVWLSDNTSAILAKFIQIIERVTAQF